MNAEKILHKWLRNVLPNFHKKRQESLISMVSSCIRGGELTVTSLGRKLCSRAKTKHNIKRADRLLSNQHLHKERRLIYRSLAANVIAEERTPVILVDWSDIDARRKFYLLRAAVIDRGRSLTVYEEVHTVATKEKPGTHRAFLNNLKDVLPAGCNPILVTDAGFRGPWFKAVCELGWDFVGRVRNREGVLISADSSWISVKLLYREASCKAKQFTNVVLTKSNPSSCNLVLYKSKPKGRILKGKMGNKRRNRTSMVNSKRAREPWLLAHSLRKTTPEKIVKIYATRMQIEESFRDLKSIQFGISLYQNRTYKIERMKTLIMIGSIAATFACLLGQLSQITNQHLQYQANSTKKKVLSNFFLGLQIFRDYKFKISRIHYHKYLQKISTPQFYLNLAL